MKKHFLHTVALAAMALASTMSLSAAESHVKILGNDKRSAPLRAHYQASDILASEDFSLFPQGTMENPVTLIPKYEMGTIDADYTNGSGWWGTGIDAVSGMCFLRNDNPRTYASLRTHLGDYSGRITIKLRVRCFQNPSESGNYTPSGCDFQIIPIAFDSNIAETDLESGIMQFRLYEKDGWAEINATFDNYCSDNEGYIAFYSDTDCLIDDLEIITSPDFIAAPTMLQLTNANDTTFTINWMPVRKSNNYYINLFTLEGYDDAGNPIFDRAFPDWTEEEFNETKEYYGDSWLTDTYVYNDYTPANSPITTYTFNGLNPDKEYYYCVLSHYVRQFSSMDEKYHAMYATVPPMLPAEDINEVDGSYKAVWTPVKKAEGYEVNNYGVRSIEEDTEDFPLLEEDFSAFEELSDATGIGDMDILPYDSNPTEFLNENTELPGWNCSGLSYAKGKIGIAYGWGANIQTPPLYVEGADHINLSLTVESEYEDGTINVTFGGQLYTIELEGYETQGEYEIPTNGYVESPIVFSSGDAESVFMIDNIRVSQDLKAGSDVYVFQGQQYIDDNTVGSCTFTDLDFTDYADYAFQVRAKREFNDPLLKGKKQTCMSPYAGRQHVLKADKPQATIVSAIKPETGINAAADYYTLQGVKTTSPKAGIYMKVENGKTQKVLFKK